MLRVAILWGLLALVAAAILVWQSAAPAVYTPAGPEELIFRGCIHLPRLPGTFEQVCLVEDARTHRRYVLDEMAGGSSSVNPPQVY